MLKANNERVIGFYDGEVKGPLFICFGAMHGNEPAGVKAIKLVQKMLEVEHIRQPEFKYKGQFLGLIGNLEAYKNEVRFHKRDLNRMFSKAYIDKLKNSILPLMYEDKELLELDKIVRESIQQYEPDKVIILDLHTTSSFGGIFTICRDDENAIKIGSALHAPIVLGMLEGLSGTTLHYFTEDHFEKPIIPITFESGQHEETLAINRAVAGIINCMKAIGALEPNIVENHHEEILLDYSEGLPAVTRLLSVHAISAEDNFVMKPGYVNFQQVKKGEVVAEDKNGPISLSDEGRILMPLYQEKGEDGFFLIKEI